MKSLHIPKRDQLKGQNIMCNRCWKKGKGFCSTKDKNGKSKWVCKTTGKRLSACEYPESQNFVSKLYTPIPKNSFIIVRHETRDFNEFTKRHQELLDIQKEMRSLYKNGEIERLNALINSFKKKSKKPKEKEAIKEEPSKEIIITQETYLETAMYIYGEFLYGRLGEDFEKRPAKKTSENYMRALERYHICLVDNGYHPQVLPLKDIGKEHLVIWAREVFKRYDSNKTQNHYLNDVSTFLEWCADRGKFQIDNYLDKVKRGETEGDTRTIKLHQFKAMLELITPENGKGKEVWTDGKTGKVRSKKKNYYRDFLKDGLWLTLLIGGRGAETPKFKWSWIKYDEDEHGKKTHHIQALDLKYFNDTGKKKYDFVVIYDKTREILDRLGFDEKVGKDEYVIAPDIDNRKTVQRNLSEGFGWFWKMYVGKNGEQLSIKHLRKTSITFSKMLQGELSKFTQKHTNSDTTREHYINKALMVGSMEGMEFKDPTNKKVKE